LFRRSRNSQRGTTTVEFSLVVPLLVLTTLGTIDAGRMVISRSMLGYAVTVGSRMGEASATTTTVQVQNAVVAAAPMLKLVASAVTVTTSAASWAARKSGDAVTVQASYTFQPAIGAWSKLITKTFSSTSTVTIP
jgi:Flp pilus assembly protein TadG